MKGIHHIIVSNGNLKYEFDLKRNITILKGDSATGKTTLIEMIQEYLVNGPDSGVNLSSDTECRVLTGNLWREQIPSDKDAIIFIDEGNRFVESQEFAEAVKQTGYYYVIVTRENLEMLPFSVDEIYGIKSSGKYGSLEPVYHNFYKIYDFEQEKQLPITPKNIVVEDSNSGYEFFQNISQENSIKCLSAGGKSNIYQILCDQSFGEDTLIIADGAAFGSQMNRLERLIKRNNHLRIYLPESFEWILLRADLFKASNIKNILEFPYDYIDSKEYFSWERFFTDLLMEISSDSYLRYQKRKLNSNYLQQHIRDKILEVMKWITFEKEDK